MKKVIKKLFWIISALNKNLNKKGTLTGWMSMGGLVGPNGLVGTPMLVSDLLLYIEWFDDAIPYPYITHQP